MKQNPYSDMDEKAYRAAYLIAGFIRQTLTEKEHDELDDWVNENDHNMQLFEDLTDENNLAANLEWMDSIHTKASYEALKQKGAFNRSNQKTNHLGIWLAAALVIVLTGLFFLYKYQARQPAGMDDISASDTAFLKPGGNRATLTLDNGKQIDLTYAKTGTIENALGSHAEKAADGALVYVMDSSATNAAAIHTLSTPAGGQYQLTLSDGTNVWLNAASTITYPPAFKAGERSVTLTGEAYFEVAKHAGQPFKVLLDNNTAVLVTGTHFNITAYQSGQQQQVTLLEGSVSVSNASGTALLEPGTQAVIKGKQITKTTVANMDAVTGWRQGLFVFHDASIETIMMQIARWYDAKVVYKAAIKQLFNANILRSEPLPRVLQLLELNGYVHFKIENKTIYVLP